MENERERGRMRGREGEFVGDMENEREIWRMRGRMRGRDGEKEEEWRMRGEGEGRMREGGINDREMWRESAGDGGDGRHRRQGSELKMEEETNCKLHN